MPKDETLEQSEKGVATDLRNWREPGRTVWSFQNVNRIIQTDLIKKGPQPSLLGSQRHNFDGIQLSLTNQLAIDLPLFLSQTETDGIVVLKDGDVIYEHYNRTNTEKSLHIIFSITKSITGLLCGILVEQGILDVNAAVASYVPEVRGSAYENVTIRQLLDMRAGIEYDDANTEYRKATGLVPLESDEKPTDLHSTIPTITGPRSPVIDGLDGPPFKYVSANADLMGWVIERATGKKFAQVISEQIWQPMGAESDAYITVDRGGNARTAAGMCVTVRDLARLGLLVLQGGRQIVPEHWLNDMLHNGSSAAFATSPEKGEFDKLLATSTYRSYWFVDSANEFLMASGTYGQHLFVDRKNGLVMAKTGSQPERTDWKKIGLAIQAVKEISRITTGRDESVG